MAPPLDEVLAISQKMIEETNLFGKEPHGAVDSLEMVAEEQVRCVTPRSNNSRLNRATLSTASGL